jgi:large subunit ribosomal protein L3
VKKNKVILGKKGRMKSFLYKNKIIPVTVINSYFCSISKLFSDSNEGYNGIQIKCKNNTTNKSNKKKNSFFLKEIRTNNISNFKIGEVLSIKDFFVGDWVNVSGRTKGLGFQGVVKRWNFSGGPKSHGSMSHRRGGSYGQCQDPGKIYKGRKMPGRSGYKNLKIFNLLIVKINFNNNEIMLKGSIPGKKGSLIIIQSSFRK